MRPPGRPRVEVQFRKPSRIDGGGVDSGGRVFGYFGGILEPLDRISGPPATGLPQFDMDGIEHQVLVDGNGAHDPRGVMLVRNGVVLAS